MDTGERPPPIRQLSSITRILLRSICGKQRWGDEKAYDGSMVSGLKYALVIHNWLTISKVNAWNYWELTGHRYDDNQGLTSSRTYLPSVPM